MQVTAAGPARLWTWPRALRAGVDPPAFCAWLLPFLLVADLALHDGGYDTVARSQAGVLVWWIVLLAALAGVLPSRIGRGGWVAIGLLGAFAAWTGVAAGWSESPERSVVELGRIAAYLGVFVLAITLQGRTAARHTVNGLACAIGTVTALAVLSRLHPQAFPHDEHLKFLGPASARKLSYPLNYWNALAAFAAMGVPLLAAVAVAGRTLAGRAAAAAVLPLSALCLYLTISRGGALALGVGLLVFLVLVPRRLDALATLVVAAAGSAILIVATSHRAALVAGEPTPPALHQGAQVLCLVAITCAGVALLQVAIGLTARHVQRPALLTAGRRTTALRGLAILAVVLVAALASGVPGQVQHRWRDFKAPSGSVASASDSTLFGRLQAANGNGRYQLWQAAAHANATDPWKGIGPGTFEFWWARHATSDGFVRDAHNLYLQTLAEAGIIGLTLIAAMLLWFVGTGLVRSLRASGDLRVWLAAALGGLAAFITSTALEWVWQMAAIAVAALTLGAVLVAGRDDTAAAPGAVAEPPSRLGRGLLAALAVASIPALLVPLGAAQAIDASRASAASGDVATALRDARTAQRLEPYAATPRLQRALVLESAGALGPAATAARAAAAAEPTNWRTWLVLARIDARRGATANAIGEVRRARSLNPRSLIWTGT